MAGFQVSTEGLTVSRFARSPRGFGDPLPLGFFDVPNSPLLLCRFEPLAVTRF
jgi:hypothetical protein